MFDSLIEVLEKTWDTIVPYYIIHVGNSGVLLRLGKFRKVLAPGLHFKIPIIDYIGEHTSVWTTFRLQPQSLITKDDKNVVIKAIVKMRVSNIRKFWCEVWGAEDAIADITSSIIKKQIHIRTWSEICSNEMDDIITKYAREEGFKWGIEIQQVTLADMGVIKTIRLISDVAHSHQTMG